MLVDHTAIIQSTKAWINKVVIQLNLCPFAKYPFDQGTIRYSVYDSIDRPELLGQVSHELGLITRLSHEEVETSLLIFPTLFKDFHEYLDFLDLCQEELESLDLEGIIQLASFHPSYQFADLHIDDVRNYTNRSPYPMIHLLREESVSKATISHSDVHAIPIKNQELLQKLGKVYFL